MRYTSEIDRTLQHLHTPYYSGTFSLDALPKPPPSNRICFVVNSDPAYRKGEHWMAICIIDTLAIFVEPYGLPLHKLLYSNPLNLYLTRHALRTETLPFPIQPFTSSECGEFCAFILERLPAYHYSIYRLAEEEFLSDDLDYNVRVVKKWWTNASI